MDLLLCETGNGGDFIFENKDLKLTDGFSNQVYLGWFGGNIGGEERDREDAPQSEQRTDWFGNELLFESDLDFYFNSELETFLSKSVLNSSQVILIEETAKLDLSFMNDFGEVSVEAEIQDLDRIQINAIIIEPDNSENKTFSFIWDSTKNEADCLCSGYVKKPDFPAPGEYSGSEYDNDEYTS